ncbi:non-homologous end-joining DNA ligase [Candidatus Parcubacteria bacterium]|nr:non-homologous end-joining DNA ligase [Candidatus Parcubacteria bacterium]
MDKEIKIKGKIVKLTNLDKVYWPKEGFTKGELIEYYRKVSKFILPYLKDRPESLNRHPHGIDGESFYQKDVDHQGPEWLRTVKIYSESNDKDVNYLVCDDEATLVYMSNLGCVEINPWLSRDGSLDNPDFSLIDLDPEGIGFDAVIEAAQVVHEVLDSMGAKHFVKTSGASGIHILIPLGAKYTYEQSRQFAHLIVQQVHEQLPKTTSLERSPADRKHKVYLDYLQNSRGQTMAAPYCVRPREGMPVSTPLDWSEVKQGLDPLDFTVKNILSRLEKKGDLLKGLLGRGVNIEKILDKLEK